ncbi:hypothetical protein GGR51DRAFT_516033 [Nemania sp. FL0031]|nr:hypothetical protein GGR51DRAFT_516033 [Nemania sp. FL0031]
MLWKLHTTTPPNEITRWFCIVPDPEPGDHRGIQETEKYIIFAETENDADLSFMHNDVTQSSIVVETNKIVGLVDREMAGFFG